MKKIYIFIFFYLFNFLHISFSYSTETYTSHANSVKNILLLNSYHDDYSWSEKVSEVIRAELKKEFNQIEIYNEYMDTKRFYKSILFEQFHHYFINKYSNVHFDLIITNDDNAFYYVVRNHDSQFAGVPVVFSGLNYLDSTLLTEQRYFTGIVENVNVRNTIDLITKLHPKFKTLYVISDNTSSARIVLNSERPILESYHQFDVVYLTGDQYSTEELLSRISDIDKRDIIYYASWNRDKDGNAYSHDVALQLISENATAPIYGTLEVFLGLGIVGGKLASSIEYGELASHFATRIINGTAPADIPIDDHIHDQFMFDYKQLQLYNIPLSRLPAESYFINKPVTFIERYGRILWIAISVFIIQAFFITALLLLYFKSKRTEKALLYDESILNSLMDNILDAIYLKDINQRYIKNNKAHLKFLKLKKQNDALGKTDFDFFDNKFAEKKYKEEKLIFESGKSLIDNIEEIKQVDGSVKWVSTTKVPIYNEVGKIETLVGVTRDITERRLRDEEIKNSLAEKEILLKEIHHRVKNNLQVISSLLSLQANSLKNDKVREVFKESQNRVKTMALIHEKLYQSQNFTNIDFNSYVNDLVGNLKRSLDISRRNIDVEVMISRIALDVNLAVPCGLIINELVSNAFKHAFNDSSDEKGKILVKLSQPSVDQVELIVSDNGVGIDENIDYRVSESLGLKLVTILVEDQLKGKLDLSVNKGTMLKVNFSLDD